MSKTKETAQQTIDKQYLAERYSGIITYAIWGLKELDFIRRKTECKIRDLLNEDFKNANKNKRRS